MTSTTRTQLTLCLAAMTVVGCSPTAKKKSAKQPPLADAATEDAGRAADAGADVAPDVPRHQQADVSRGALDTGPAGALQRWNVMVYMAGDNNLEGPALDDVREMLALPAADHVRFHVQLDRGKHNGDAFHSGSSSVQCSRRTFV